MSSDDIVIPADVSEMMASLEADPTSKAWAHYRRHADHFGVVVGGGSGGGDDEGVSKPRPVRRRAKRKMQG